MRERNVRLAEVVLQTRLFFCNWILSEDYTKPHSFNFKGKYQ